jgi:hypothetical protein
MPLLATEVTDDFTCLAAIGGYSTDFTTPVALHFGAVFLNMSTFSDHPLSAHPCGHSHHPDGLVCHIVLALLGSLQSLAM